MNGTLTLAPAPQPRALQVRKTSPATRDSVFGQLQVADELGFAYLDGDIDFGATGKNEIFQCIKHIILTEYFSVPLDREFGFDYSMVDKPMAIAEAVLSQEVATKIALYEPRAQFRQIDFVRDEINGKLSPSVVVVLLTTEEGPSLYGTIAGGGAVIAPATQATIAAGEAFPGVITGLPGPQGPPGASATVTVGATITGAPGTDALVIDTGTPVAAVLEFTIPRGDKGDPGTGVTIKGTVPTSASLPATGNTAGDMWIAADTGHGWSWDGAAWVDVGPIQGPPGNAAAVAAGTTITGAAGTNANVVNVGTSSNAVFNFTIPQGIKGDPGGSTSAFEYMFSANTVEPPTGSELRLNNASQPAATKAWIKYSTATGVDATVAFKFAKAGQQLYLQDKDDSSKHQEYDIIGNAVDKGTYAEIPLAWKSGGTPVAEQRIVVGLVHTGPQGPAGPPNVLTVSGTTTGTAGSNASVVISGTSPSQSLAFTIPRGDQGIQGIQGIQGPQGITGAAATVAVGTTTTGAAGTNAAVTNSGTSSAAVLNFTIPQGIKGDQGVQGPQGAQGIAGNAATVTAGTTATGAAGSAANVTNSGTSSAAIFNFTIPQGIQGLQGIQGPPGIGDVVGPASSVDNQIALFSGTSGKLIKADGDINSITPVGVILDFAGTAAPAGWLFCFGQSLARTGTYAALFAVIGTTYGAVDANNFTLPDLRGRVAAGKDDMGGTSADRLANIINGDLLGNAGGVDRYALAINDIPSHTHGITYPGTGGVTPLTANGGSGVFGNCGTGGPQVNYSFPTINNAGGGLPHTNLQPTIILNKIIKY